VKIQVLDKGIHFSCNTNSLSGPKTAPLFSEKGNVSDNNVLCSLNASAIQTPLPVQVFKNVFALHRIFLHNIKVLLLPPFRHRDDENTGELSSKFSL
jgi:hypothetical protein